jgi:PKD repeat protein
MKTKINVLLSCFLLLLAVAFISSCGDDDDGDPKPTAAFTPSKTTATAGEDITFTNESTNATSYTWSFGDGTTSTEESPVKSYAVAGNYTVTLLAKGAGGTNSTTADITIQAGNEIFFIDIDDAKIAKFAISAPATVTNVLDITDKNGLALAYDATNQKIYFSGLDVDEVGGVWKVNPDGTGVTNVVTDLYDPYGIALNVAANKLYITDFGEEVGAIYQTSLTGTGKITVVENEEESGYAAVALDLVNSKMYYFPYDDENLYRANLDGTGKEVVVAGAFGYGILVDAANNKIYYNNRNSAGGDLMSASLTGTNPVTVDATASRIYGIAIHNNKLYWSSRENGAIYQANLDGTGKVTLKSGLSSPRGIFVK